MPTSYIRILKSFLRIRDRGSCTRYECHSATASPLAVRQRQGDYRAAHGLMHAFSSAYVYTRIFHPVNGLKGDAVTGCCVGSLRPPSISLPGINEGRRKRAARSIPASITLCTLLSLVSNTPFVSAASGFPIWHPFPSLLSFYPCFLTHSTNTPPLFPASFLSPYYRCHFVLSIP